MGTTKVRAVSIAAASLAVAACSTAPGHDVDQRRFDEQERRAQFVQFRDACLAQDRLVFIDARGSHPRHGIPGKRDRYYCI